VPNLTQKLGPLPLWAWGGLAAVGVWFFFLRDKTGTSTGATNGSGVAGATTPGPNSVYGLGYAQGLQAGAVQPAPAPAKSGPAPCDPTQWKQMGAGFLYAPGGSAASVPIAGQTYFYLQTPGAVQGYLAQGGQVFFFPAPCVPVPTIFGPGGPSPGTPAYGVSSSPTAIGGPAPRRSHAVGSRSAWLWHDAHPGIGAPVRYPHFVRAVGGPANHRREVQRVAAQSGVHPARIGMLNPVPTGMIRVA